MYESALNLNARPFAARPTGEQPLFGNSMLKAISSTGTCIERGNGPALIVGAPGVGKTLLLSQLGHQYRSQHHVVHLSCSRLDGRLEFLQTILFELNRPYRGLSEGELRLSLLDFLRTDREKPEGLLLLIDDAENLSVEVLDEIRVVSNFVQDGRGRTKLVLAGGFRLEELLSDPRLQSLNQRIATRCFLRNLGQAETRDYICDQIRQVGGDWQRLFDEQSLETVFELSEGCVRQINQVCDQALVLCVTCGATKVSPEMVREAWSDLQCFPDTMCQPSTFSQSNPHSSQSGVEPGSDWSIIEFGTLDEEPSEPGLRQAESSDDCCQDYQTFAQTSPWCGQPNQSEQLNFPRVTRDRWTRFIEETPGENYNPYESQTVWSNDSDAAADGNRQLGCDSDRLRQDLSDSSEPVIETPAPAPYVAINPFAETYHEVEVVKHRFAQKISQQNRSSQTLMPQDVSCLHSLASELDAAAGNSDSEFRRSLSGQDCCCDVSPQTCSVHSVQPQSYSQQPERVELRLPNQPGSQACGEEKFGSQNRGYCRSESSDSNVARNSHIASEADALLQQLASAFGEPIDHFDRPQSESCQPAQEAKPTTYRFSNDGFSSMPANNRDDSQSGELQDLESLRASIEEQNKFSAQAFSRISLNTQQGTTGGWRILPAPLNNDASQYPAIQENTCRQDDRDILVCQPSEDVPSNRNNQQGSSQFPFPPTPVSTGKAERMDYQQLFDQLRNLPSS